MNMAQPSVACYFGTRKRAANDFLINSRTKKILLETEGIQKRDLNFNTSKIISSENPKNETPRVFSEKSAQSKDVKGLLASKVCLSDAVLHKPKVGKKVSRHAKEVPKRNPHQRNIQEVVCNMAIEEGKQNNCFQRIEKNEPKNSNKNDTETVKNNLQSVKHDTQLDEIKHKICKSSKLPQLKAALAKFNESAKKLKEIEKKKSEVESKKLEVCSPKLQTFKTIQVEVPLSPKVFSPEKPYLSPKKVDSARKNLLGLLSPSKTKNAVAIPFSPSKEIQESLFKSTLALPFKYRYLAEMFRAIDTVCQILYNRKEDITFRKLKPAVEEMLKRNLTLKHIAQIKKIFPDAFSYEQKKLRVFGTGRKEEQWELVLKPFLEKDHMTSEFLLERRRKLFKILLEKVKDYHQEFLLSLDPPMRIPKEKITHWHAEFSLEKVPDVEEAELPKPPNEDKITTAKEVLERAREMFGHNSRMEQALEKLKATKEANLESTEKTEKPKEPISLLKGIPAALLEKVRQKQAAKALISMTRSEDKEKEVLHYSRLPEIARLTRNLFVTERKNVLLLDTVLNRLENSYRCFLTKSEMEDHLKTISKETEGWLVFHEIRGTKYIKLIKSADISVIISKLETLAKQKNES